MVKIDIISGFLGAGKTTLIKKFIQEAFQGEKLVLIENEFGEIGVDAEVITATMNTMVIIMQMMYLQVGEWKQLVNMNLTRLAAC